MNLSSIVKLHQTQNLIFGAYMCMGTHTHTHTYTHTSFLNELYEKSVPYILQREPGILILS